MSDASVSMLFQALSENGTLNKLRISGIHLGGSRNIHYLSSFIKENISLTELDLSWAGLTLRQQVQVYTEIKENMSIKSLNMAYNSVDFSKLSKRPDDDEEK